jgi:MoaA/NifB/PqqE/SkfB family radical SAM enzyme
MSLQETGLMVVWRGSLASCNYGCAYCPFAKTTDDRKALAADRAALERFEAWVASRPYQVSIFMTPWGEALIRNYYRDAITRLSHLANVSTVAVQTNLSCSVNWLKSANLNKAALWTTYHPSETPRGPFVKKIHQLASIGARYSVGVVGLNEHVDEIELLRRELPDAAYLWVNAYKRVPDYYTTDELDRLIAIDPLFELNNRNYASLGRACHTGETAISVLADGTARRCHFLRTPIGNIFDDNFEDVLKPRVCTADSCRCHIGYSHLKDLNLRDVFGTGFVERRPAAAIRTDGLSAMVAFDENPVPLQK